MNPLYIIIVADNDDQLDKGVEEVQKILKREENLNNVDGDTLIK